MNNRIKTLLSGLVMALMATAIYVALPGGPALNNVAYGAALVAIVVMVLSALILWIASQTGLRAWLEQIAT